jgi:HNH/ENDO VII superfamily nuclease
MAKFLCRQNKNLEFNPNRLAIMRPERIIASRYGPIFDGGLSPRGAVPLDDPWLGIHNDANFTWDQKNLELMLNGQPPWGRDGKRMVLHHRNNQANGPLDEYSWSRHNQQHGLMHNPDAAVIDNAVGSYRSRSEYDEQVWSRQRGRYWVSRALAHLDGTPFN